jgi:hypothetical protein
LSAVQCLFKRLPKIFVWTKKHLCRRNFLFYHWPSFRTTFCVQLSRTCQSQWIEVLRSYLCVDVTCCQVVWCWTGVFTLFTAFLPGRCWGGIILVLYGTNTRMMKVNTRYPSFVLQAVSTVTCGFSFSLNWLVCSKYCERAGGFCDYKTGTWSFARFVENDWGRKHRSFYPCLLSSNWVQCHKLGSYSCDEVHTLMRNKRGALAL